MKVTSVFVSGFRNVDSTKIRLNGIVGLVSTNNYGKSNLLAAIDFGFDFISAGQKLRQYMMKSVDNIPLVPRLQDSPFIFQIEFDDGQEGPYRFVRYSFSFDWNKDDGTGSRIISEKLECHSKPTGIYSVYLDRKVNKYRASHDTRSKRKIYPEDTQLALDVLSALDDVELSSVVRKIKSLSFNLSADIDVQNRFIPEYFEMKNSFWGHEDLAAELYELRSQSPEKYAVFEEGVYSLFPEFKQISVELYKNSFKGQIQLDTQKELPFKIKDDIIRLMVNSSHLNQVIDMDRMSAGTKRTVWLLAKAILASKEKGGYLLAIEEIETGIHPRLIKELLEQINDNLGDSSLLVTSHSPYLIQYLKPDHIYVGLPNDDGVAQFKNLIPERFKEFLNSSRTRNMGFGEYLYSLMSGSEDGERVLRKYVGDV